MIGDETEKFVVEFGIERTPFFDGRRNNMV